MRSTWPKNAFVYLLILVASVALFYSFLAPVESAREIDLNKVAQFVQQGRVERLAFTSDGNMTIEVREGTQTTTYTSRKEPNVGIGETLINLGVTPEQVSTIGELVAQRPSIWENWGIAEATVINGADPKATWQKMAADVQSLIDG